MDASSAKLGTCPGNNMFCLICVVPATPFVDKTKNTHGHGSVFGEHVGSRRSHPGQIRGVTVAFGPIVSPYGKSTDYSSPCVHCRTRFFTYNFSLQDIETAGWATGPNGARAACRAASAKCSGAGRL